MDQRQCEPNLAFGARGGIVRDAAGRVQQSRHFAADPTVPGFALPSVEAAAPAAAAPAAQPETPLAGLARQSRPQKRRTGRQGLRDLPQLPGGQGREIGPDLWGVVGRKIASVPGFEYSDSLKGVSGDWTYEVLNKWITDPKALASGTKMTFPGEKSEQRRADILAYLQTLSD